MLALSFFISLATNIQYLVRQKFNKSIANETFTHMQTLPLTYINTYTHTYIYIQMLICTDVRVCVCVCVCLCVHLQHFIATSAFGCLLNTNFNIDIFAINLDNAILWCHFPYPYIFYAIICVQESLRFFRLVLNFNLLFYCIWTFHS